MQNNNTATERGNYVIFSSQGQITNEVLNVPRGYYTYSFLGNLISYSSKLNTSHSVNIRYGLSSNGYMDSTTGSASVGVLNPKMISMDEMNNYGSNVFSFNSYTPKLKIKSTTGIINGAVIKMRLESAWLTDFCDDSDTASCSNNSNSEFYLYAEVWDDENLVGNMDKTVLPTLKFKINKSNPSEDIRAVIDKLDSSKNYYYNVYAYLNVNNTRRKIQLFDANSSVNKTSTYNFTTLGASDIFHNFDVSYKTNDKGNYGDRLIDTKINLNAYQNQEPFNYDITYAFCELGDTSCGISVNSSDEDVKTNIFEQTIVANKLGTSIVNTVDVSNLKKDDKKYELEYGKNYYMYIYAVFDYYDNDSKRIIKKALQINQRNVQVNLRKLRTPEFVVSREAVLNSSNYAIDFVINLNDYDKTLKDGKYFVKLLDSNNNIVGDLQVVDDNNNYITVRSNGDYENYEFDANVTNKKIRIANLSANTSYKFLVYSLAKLNNADEILKEKEINKEHIVYTTTDYGVAFGSLDFRVNENSVVVTFLGGSSFNNVKEVSYTIGLWDNNATTSTVSGSYDLTTGGKKFEKDLTTSNWRFVIDPDNMNNKLGETYTITLGFRIDNPNSEDDYYIDSSTPGYENVFTGRNTYIKDNDNNN